MRIPRYWAGQHGVPANGTPPRVDVWGWSDVSVADAERVAGERLAEVLARAESQGGLPSLPDEYYPRVPLREPVIAPVGEGDDPSALITRNRYGADVLNTERLFIADVDVPAWEEREPGSGGGFLRRRTPSVEEEVARLEPVLQREAQRGWRVYRTRAGLRVLLDGAGLAPGSEHAMHLLEQLGSDRLYVQLTRTYDSYRARLSPKPWRIGLSAMPSSARRVVDDALVDDPGWLAGYDRAASKFAVCRFVAEGAARFGDEAQALVTLHDQLTGAHRTDLPLA